MRNTSYQSTKPAVHKEAIVICKVIIHEYDKKSKIVNKQ